MDDAEEIGGYRVLRRLTRGGRAEVLLAHGGEPPVAVVVKRADAGDPAGLREVAALERGAGEHVVRLLDVAGDDDHLDLVLEQVAGGDLARLLAERTVLEGGEAVTLLAPVATTIARLHDAGVAHGALTPAAVLFRGDGTPVLAGFGAAGVFASDAPEVERDRVPEVVSDRAAVRQLAATVLGRVGGSRRRAAQGLAAHLATVDDADLVACLADRIFDVASARPVRDRDPETDVRATAGSGSSSVPGAIGVGAARTSAGGATRIVPLADPVADDAGAPARRFDGWAARVERLLDRAPAAELRAAVMVRWARLSTGRRRLALGGAVAGAVLVVALVAVPGPAPDPAQARPSPGASGGASAGPASSASGRSASQAPTATPSRRDADDATLRGDDPVAAAGVLLAARAACRRELSVLCLDGVDQDGSAASASDGAAIQAAQGGGELGDDPLAGAAGTAPVLRERLGDSALVALAGGASVLLLRTPDGWRIRDILAAPAS